MDIEHSPPLKRIKLEEEEVVVIDTANVEVDSDEDHCTICLQDIVDRAVIPTCSHEFCFECIMVWAEQSRRCPLCAQSYGDYVIHNIRSKYDYQKHYLTPLRTSPKPLGRPLGRRAIAASNRRPQRREPYWGRRQREAHEEADALERAVAKRRWVYRHDLYAKHVASNSYTRYRPFPTPAQFAASTDLISRTTIFLRRELHVWPNLDVEFLVTFVLSLMKAIDIRSESAVKLLAEFLDMDVPYVPGGRFFNAEHFAHEVYSYVRSPYKDLAMYDAAVQYDVPEGLPAPQTTERSSRWTGRHSRSPSSPRNRPPHRSHSFSSRSHSPDTDSRHHANVLSPRRSSPGRGSGSGQVPVEGQGFRESMSLSHTPHQSPTFHPIQNGKDKGKQPMRDSEAGRTRAHDVHVHSRGGQGGGRPSSAKEQQISKQGHGDSDTDGISVLREPQCTKLNSVLDAQVHHGESAQSADAVRAVTPPTAVDADARVLKSETDPLPPPSPIDGHTHEQEHKSNNHRQRSRRDPRHRTLLQTVQAHLQSASSTSASTSRGGASPNANSSAARESTTHNGESSPSMPSLLSRMSDAPIHSAGDATANDDINDGTDIPSAETCPKLSAREITARTRARLAELASDEAVHSLQPGSDLPHSAAHLHQQEASSVSGGSGLEGSGSNEGLRTPTFATPSTSAAPSLSAASREPSSPAPLSPGPTAPPRNSSTSKADLRARLLNKLEDERRLTRVQVQVGSADGPTSSRTAIATDHVEPPSVPPVPMAEERERHHQRRRRQRGGLTSEEQLHQVESRLRTQAQLRVRLAAERRLADGGDAVNLAQG